MARETFGGTANDFAFGVTSGGFLKLAHSSLSFWDAETGGNRYTDLLVGGATASTVTVPDDGQIPEFQGPDGVTEMWADGGAGRVLIRPSDAVPSAALDDRMTQVAQDTSSAFRAQQMATYAKLAPAPTGDAAVDTANLQALIDSMPATGGVIRLQAGTYGMQGYLTIDRPIEIVGLGSGDPYGTNAVTVLSYPLTTGNAITITSRGVRLRNFLLSTSAAHVSGAGISTTGADGLQIIDCVVSGFMLNVDIDASEWLIDRCRIHKFRQYGVRVRAIAMPDSGDWTISNSWFTTESYDSDASLRFESGGGGKITATKFNAHAVRNVDDTWEPGRALHHIDVALTSAATSSDFQVDPSCSFESTRGSLIHFAQDGASTAEFRNIILMGEFATYNSTATVPGTPAIEIVPTNGIAGPFSNVLIDGVFLGEFGFGTAVVVDNVNYLEIRGVFQNWDEKWAVTEDCTYVRLPEPETRWIPAQQLAVSDNYGGTITRAAESRSDAVKLSAAGFQTLAATLAPIPWNAYTVKVYWVNAGAGAGDVVWRYDFQNIGAGDTLDAAGTANTPVTATAGAQDVVQVTTLATVGAAPADFLSARLIRVGDDAADTLGNDVAVLGLLIEKLN